MADPGCCSNSVALLEFFLEANGTIGTGKVIGKLAKGCPGRIALVGVAAGFVEFVAALGTNVDGHDE